MRLIYSKSLPLVLGIIQYSPSTSVPGDRAELQPTRREESRPLSLPLPACAMAGLIHLWPTPCSCPRRVSCLSLSLVRIICGLHLFDASKVGLGVVKSGELAMLTGSSHLHLGLTDDR